ncbi:carbohydrate sulfotransferase 15-like [Diadema antillarum]|uniref:carbohydrate sulfotransferase 15-like n=1 Tax=Diadema antillarum TaxID=105358 RepID=UPI003A891024
MTRQAFCFKVALAVVVTTACVSFSYLIVSSSMTDAISRPAHMLGSPRAAEFFWDQSETRTDHVAGTAGQSDSRSEYFLRVGDASPSKGIDQSQSKSEQVLNLTHKTTHTSNVSVIRIPADANEKDTSGLKEEKARVAPTKENTPKLRFERMMREIGAETIGDPISYDRNNIPQELRQLAPQVFSRFPHSSEFLPEYKSPCWKGKQSGALRCLPYFFLGGFPKCGTTDLWGKLIRHPGMVKTVKEPHWWTTTDNLNVDKYFSHQYALVKSIQTTGKKYLTTCDASALTFQDNKRLIQRMPLHLQKSLKYVNADILRAVLPDTRFVGILRNPTDRAYSSYLYFDAVWKRVKSPIDFHKRIVQAIAEYYRCTDAHGPRYCAYVKIVTHVNVGCYSIYVRDYLRRFPREQLYFLRTEDWSKDHSRYMKEIYTFLDLDPMSEEFRGNASVGVNLNQRKVVDKRVGPMLPQTRKLLDEFFRPCNEDLAKLLNDDKYLWLD